MYGGFAWFAIALAQYEAKKTQAGVSLLASLLSPGNLRLDDRLFLRRFFDSPVQLSNTDQHCKPDCRGDSYDPRDYHGTQHFASWPDSRPGWLAGLAPADVDNTTRCVALPGYLPGHRSSGVAGAGCGSWSVSMISTSIQDLCAAMALSAMMARRA